jgi:hypothetical protein
VKRELPIPPKVETAEKAEEVLRAWIIDDALHCYLHPKTWMDEPETWGRFFADTVQIVSNAVAEETGKNRAELRNLIREIMNQELDSLSD